MQAASDAPMRYKLSFSVGGLFLHGAPIGARLYRDHHDWSAVRDRLDAGNLLQARTTRSATRLGQGFKGRHPRVRTGVRWFAGQLHLLPMPNPYQG